MNHVKHLYVLELTMEAVWALTEAVMSGTAPSLPDAKAEYEVRQRIVAMLDNQRNAYRDGDGRPATDAVGLAVARYFQWDWRVLDACIAALEDANFHDEAADLLARRRSV